MTSTVASVLAFASIPALAVMLGGSAAAFRTPSATVRSAVQHLAAGIVFAALAVELLPEVIHRRLPLITVLGFGVGVAVMLGLKSFSSRWENLEGAATAGALPIGLLVASGVDIAIDGLLIGIGFVAGERQGVLLTLALTLEVLFLGVASAAALGGSAGSRGRILAVSSVFAILLLAGAGAGAAFLSGASPVVIDAVLSFGVAALLYLVTEELLVEAHEVPETPVLTSMFFLGFITLLVIDMLL